MKLEGALRYLVTGVMAAGCAGTQATPAASPRTVSAETGAAWRLATPETYDAASMWVCRPDLPADACRENRDATELRADGSEIVVPFVPGAGTTADCFYVYPTVDLTMTPGNHTDFTDTDRMREWTFGQVARFGETCRLFAPLYRQMTFGTYFGSDEEHAHRFELAYADVLASFRWYLAHVDAGRPLVLIGHSLPPPPSSPPPALPPNDPPEWSPQVTTQAKPSQLAAITFMTLRDMGLLLRRG